MLLVNEKDFKVESSSRLVKAGDAAAVRTAEEVVAAAKAEAARITAAAKEAFEAERRRGFEQGFEEGRAKIAADKLEFVYESAACMEKVEARLADVVVKALRKCVSQVDDRELVMDVVRKLMKAVIHNQRHVSLKVSPEMVAEVRARISGILGDYPALEHVDVEEDSRLAGAAAIIETEAGIADASVETQIAAIEASIKKHFARDGK